MIRVAAVEVGGRPAIEVHADGGRLRKVKLTPGRRSARGGSPGQGAEVLDQETMTAGGQDAAADLVTGQLLALEDHAPPRPASASRFRRGGGQARAHHDHVDLARPPRSRHLRQVDDRDAQGAGEGLAVALALHHHSRRPAAFGDGRGPADPASTPLVPRRAWALPAPVEIARRWRSRLVRQPVSRRTRS